MARPRSPNPTPDALRMRAARERKKAGAAPPSAITNERTNPEPVRTNIATKHTWDADRLFDPVERVAAPPLPPLARPTAQAAQRKRWLCGLFWGS